MILVMSLDTPSPWPPGIQRVEIPGGVCYVLPPRIESPGVFSAVCGFLFSIVPLALAGFTVAAMLKFDWKHPNTPYMAIVFAAAFSYFLFGGIRWVRSWLIDVLPCGVEIICAGDTLTGQTTLRGLRCRRTFRREAIGSLTTQMLLPIEDMPPATRLVVTLLGKKGFALAENYPLAWLNAIAHDVAKHLDPTGNLPVVELPMQTYEDLFGEPEPEALAVARKRILASQDDPKA